MLKLNPSIIEIQSLPESEQMAYVVWLGKQIKEEGYENCVWLHFISECEKYRDYTQYMTVCDEANRILHFKELDCIYERCNKCADKVCKVDEANR